MRRSRWLAPVVATLVLAVSGAAGTYGAEPVTGPGRFAASSGLFELAVPAGWTAEEHPDGGGVTVASEAGGTMVTFTFTPSSVLQSGGLRMAAPAGAGAMAIAEGIAILIPPAEGVEAGSPTPLDLANGTQAVEISAAGTDVQGALYIQEPAPGVTAIVSAATGPGEYAGARDTVLELLSGLVFTGDEAGLMAVLDPPPLVDIALG